MRANPAAALQLSSRLGNLHKIKNRPNSTQPETVTLHITSPESINDIIVVGRSKKEKVLEILIH